MPISINQYEGCTFWLDPEIFWYCQLYVQWLSGWWFGTFFFSHILGIIIPIDFHIFQRGSNHQPVVFASNIFGRLWCQIPMQISSMNLGDDLFCVSDVAWFSHHYRHYISIFMINFSYIIVFVDAEFLIHYIFLTGWWFGTCFIFPYIGNNHPNWLSYFSEGFKAPTSWWLMVGWWLRFFTTSRDLSRVHKNGA